MPTLAWGHTMNHPWFAVGTVMAILLTTPAAAGPRDATQPLSIAADVLPITELDWRVVNDTVMGGVSQSRVETSATVTFAGELSLEQNGGFASMRAQLPAGAFTDATALRLALRGDGRTYTLTLRRADVPLRAGSYRLSMATEVGASELVIPLSAFRPASFGRPVMGAPALDSGLDQVDTIGVMLADKQPGPFELELLAMTVVKGAPHNVETRAALVESLQAAVAQGVPLYNGGDAEGCRDVYATALQAALDLPGVTPGERSIIEEALNGAASQRSEAGAWTLRQAIDSEVRAGG